MSEKSNNIKIDEVEVKIKNEDKKSVPKIVAEIVQLICTAATVVAAYIGIFYTIPDVINNTNEQTQVVIEPREGDIIVKDGDDYKLLQLINYNDIIFPTKIQEVQFSSNDSKLNRVDIGNEKNEDWSKRDSFQYVINSFSINSNKVINLLDNIESITVNCDFYLENNISTIVELEDEDSFKFAMRRSIDESDFEVTKTNIRSEKEYVTNEINDGIEWVKIRVDIVYKIGDRKVKDSIVSDWIETDADI